GGAGQAALFRRAHDSRGRPDPGDFDHDRQPLLGLRPRLAPRRTCGRRQSYLGLTIFGKTPPTWYDSAADYALTVVRNTGKVPTWRKLSSKKKLFSTPFWRSTRLTSALPIWTRPAGINAGCGSAWKLS